MAHGASARTSTSGQFVCTKLAPASRFARERQRRAARSSPLQAVSQSGPPACFGQNRAASARTAALARNLSCDSRPSSLDSTSSLAAVIIDCLDFLQHGGRARPHLVGRCRPRTRLTAYKQLRISSHKLRGPRCLSSHNRTYRQFLARSSPLQAVSPEKDCAGQSFVARGRPAPGRLSSHNRANGQLVVQSSPLQAAVQDSAGQSCVAHGASARTSTNGQFCARGPPVCFGQPRAASARLAPIQAASQDSRAKLSSNHRVFRRRSP